MLIYLGSRYVYDSNQPGWSNREGLWFQAHKASGNFSPKCSLFRSSMAMGDNRVLVSLWITWEHSIFFLLLPRPESDYLPPFFTLLVTMVLWFWLLNRTAGSIIFQKFTAWFFMFDLKKMQRKRKGHSAFLLKHDVIDVLSICFFDISCAWW